MPLNSPYGTSHAPFIHITSCTRTCPPWPTGTMYVIFYLNSTNLIAPPYKRTHHTCRFRSPIWLGQQKSNVTKMTLTNMMSSFIITEIITMFERKVYCIVTFCSPVLWLQYHKVFMQDIYQKFISQFLLTNEMELSGYNPRQGAKVDYHTKPPITCLRWTKL